MGETDGVPKVIKGVVDIRIGSWVEVVLVVDQAWKILHVNEKQQHQGTWNTLIVIAQNSCMVRNNGHGVVVN